ncbi:DNA/RNA non-specific endonuclease [Lapidilactobacillus bayanensis]|uniref:DNA/RNA non-specific endonuclease n=1 Tax=Lapidilactobacillus bayanensis TaxID=2485998 RepID=UPI001CDBA3FF|nr:DNA/RNA non-specific endonuclease [Lapidilactobacillus bayanensis]
MYNFLINVLTIMSIILSIATVIALFQKITKRKPGKWLNFKNIGFTLIALLGLLLVSVPFAPNTSVTEKHTQTSSLAAPSSKKTDSTASSKKKATQATERSKSIAAEESSKKLAEKQASEKAATESSQARATSIAQAKNQNNQTILKKLVDDTNARSAGPTKNYYWDNGAAKITDFTGITAGQSKFSADSQQRSSTARAVLTYSQYVASKGKRQGDPLEPPSWPYTNPTVAITYSLTNHTYHGWLYNRSHSIGDSLLGSDSYTSEYNFTTGTRSQNVGANQNGGMRYAEEMVENYWTSHPDTKTTVYYETTPLYYNSETIPRGSIVDIKSSDGVLNKEIVVINDAEGISIDYNNGTSKSLTPTTSKSSSASTKQSSVASATTPTTSTPATSTPKTTTPTTSGGWTIAPAGQVFVSDSNKYYARVTNPGNYRLMSQSEADKNGYARASRGNQYARPY